MTNAGHDDETTHPSNDGRLSALEAEVAALRGDVAELRRLLGAGERVKAEAPVAPPDAERTRQSLMAAALRARPKVPARASMTGDELESWVGRYGTLASAALVILLGLGTLVVWAVKSGLLTPEVRVTLGAITAACVAGAGLYFRRRGELRYGNVLLALSLAMVDVVAWGAGPQLHLVPSVATLAVVVVVAITLAALALYDASEFLFGVATAGALSAPFVAAEPGGQSTALLSYGAAVLLGGVWAGRRATWGRAMTLLLAGAAIYVLAAAALPIAPEWYGPYVIPIFGGALALGALLLASSTWKGSLSRAFLAVALLGVAVGWDAVALRPLAVTAVIALALATVTYAALRIDAPEQRLWVPSALVLPLLSLGVALAGARVTDIRSGAFVLWGLIALAMWRAELGRDRPVRGGAHLFVGGVLVALGITTELWPHPLGLVAGLAAWGVILALLARDESSPLPLVGASVTLGAAALSALDQLMSLRPYHYTPFATRASASALCVVLALASASAAIARGQGAAATIATRGVRLGVVIGVAFIWGRMEVVHAFSRDAGTFLLTLYYAAVGVAAILAGRKLGLKALRVGGLALAIYAAAKAVIEATNITSLLLRVGCYAAVGVFLLGAGYVYRDALVRGRDS
jgi:hypothetical protein